MKKFSMPEPKRTNSHYIDDDENVRWLDQVATVRSDYPNAGILNAGISQIIIIFEENERFCSIFLFFDAIWYGLGFGFFGTIW